MKEVCASLRNQPFRRDLSGKTFGRLTAICRVRKEGICHLFWSCRCSCGVEKDVLQTHLLQGFVLSCGCGRKIGKENAQWRGHEEISAARWSAIRRHAAPRHLAFTITIQEAWRLFIGQDRKCALSGRPIAHPVSCKKKATASLDRIDNTKGYVAGNVQWVHKDINKMKNVHSQEYFIELCKAVAAHG